jgi:predicted nucleotidyltransferase
MNTRDPNIPIVELVARALGPLRDELVLVGGCSVGLLITDQGRPPVRPTVDVDLVAEVASTAAYYQTLMPKLKAQGFKESPEESNMCRWKKGALILDVMPSDETVLGHSTNRWYGEVVRSARRMRLPSELQILVVSAPLFIATKLVAFHDRGEDDYACHDMEDIVNVIDGRPELGDEVDAAGAAVKDYIREEFDMLVTDAAFIDQLPMHFRPGAADQGRVPALIGRLRRLAGL